jgi:hypothetical protein
MSLFPTGEHYCAASGKCESCTCARRSRNDFGGVLPCGQHPASGPAPPWSLGYRLRLSSPSLLPAPLPRTLPAGSHPHWVGRELRARTSLVAGWTRGNGLRGEGSPLGMTSTRVGRPPSCGTFGPSKWLGRPAALAAAAQV